MHHGDHRSEAEISEVHQLRNPTPRAPADQRFPGRPLVNRRPPMPPAFNQVIPGDSTDFQRMDLIMYAINETAIRLESRMATLRSLRFGYRNLLRLCLSTGVPTTSAQVTAARVAMADCRRNIFRDTVVLLNQLDDLMVVEYNVLNPDSEDPNDVDMTPYM